MTTEKQNDNKQTPREFVISRTFNAPRSLVWKVHTEVEHLAKWWGPAGFKMVQTKLDLKPGGIFHYGMQAPDGSVMWGKFVYREVVPEERIVFINSFSDENGGTTRHPMAQKWPLEMMNVLTLTEENGKTILTLRGSAYNATDEERHTYESNFDSMNQGFSGTFAQLDAYLEQIQ